MDDSTPAERLLLQGSLLCDAGNASGAERKIREALSLDPNSADAHAMLSFTLCALGRRREALREAGIALSIEPDHTDGHLSAARANIGLKRYEVAETHLETALRKDPDDVEGHLLRAWMYEEQRDLVRLEQVAKKILEIEPENDLALVGIAGSLFLRDETRLATELALEVLKVDPSSSVAHHLLADIALYVGDREGAECHARASLKSLPDNPAAYLTLRAAMGHPLWWLAANTRHLKRKKGRFWLTGLVLFWGGWAIDAFSLTLADALLFFLGWGCLLPCAVLLRFFAMRCAHRALGTDHTDL